MVVRAPGSVGYLVKIKGHGKVYYSNRPANIVSHASHFTSTVSAI